MGRRRALLRAMGGQRRHNRERARFRDVRLFLIFTNRAANKIFQPFSLRRRTNSTACPAHSAPQAFPEASTETDARTNDYNKLELVS